MVKHHSLEDLIKYCETQLNICESGLKTEQELRLKKLQEIEQWNRLPKYKKILKSINKNSDCICCSIGCGLFLALVIGGIIVGTS